MKMFYEKDTDKDLIKNKKIAPNSLNIKSYWNSSLNLGVCADWFVGPRLEAGWISANDLYKKIIK